METVTDIPNLVTLQTSIDGLSMMIEAGIFVTVFLLGVLIGNEWLRHFSFWKW